MYNGEAISENEWSGAEEEAWERSRDDDIDLSGECFICGAANDRNGCCENGCNIED